MRLIKNWFKSVIRRISNIQRIWRRHKFYTLIHKLLKKRKKESVELL